jgi:DNA-binding SARP family transcriptional activator/streptogramin lyase
MPVERREKTARVAVDRAAKVLVCSSKPYEEGPVEFRVLGPLEVVDGERQVSLGGAKQRSVLALLILAGGRPVPTDVLIEKIWNGDGPETARKSVQGYVSALREALGDGRIQTLERGYALRVDPGDLDADRLEAAVRAAAETEPARTLERLRDALRLVRGEPLEDLRREPWAEREAAHLDELVLIALEARLDTELLLGEHRRLIPELERLVGKHPNREHLLEQLMLALYRADRQADALDVYRRGTMQLRSDLGLEPSRNLQGLERAILNHDPSLDAPRTLHAERAALRRRSGWKLIALAGVVIAGAAAGAAGLLATGGAVSYASLKPGVVLLDMQRHRVIKEWPGRYFNFPWAFTGDGHFWLASFNRPGTEIDPHTGRFLRQFLPPDGADIALPRVDGMWFTTPSGLVEYDLRVHEESPVVAKYRIVHGTHRFGLVGIADGAGSLWVASHEENEIVRVDPSTGKVQARIPVRLPSWLAYDDGSLWTTSDVDGVERIDPETNTVVAVARVPEPIDEVRVGGGFAWATNAPKGVVYKIDPSGQIAATYETGDGAHEPSFSAGKLWVSNADAGTLTSIDAASGETRTYRFGHPLGTEAALGRYVIVAILNGVTVEDQLAKLHGSLAKLVVPIFQFDPPDPPLTTNPFILQLERATCGQLLRFSPATGALEPDLAAAMPTVSTDRRTYTFTVRHRVRFAPPSGAPVTAQAVKYSIERALSPKLGTPRPAATYLQDLERVRVRNDRISFTLRAPSPDFLERLSLPYYCTVPYGTPIVNGGLQPIAPPSTGPYYMASRDNGAWTVLKRNPYYRGSHPATLDAIVIREGLDAEKAVGEVERGGWQGLALTDRVVLAGSAVARRFAHAGGSLTYRVLPMLHLDYLALNAGRGPLRDVVLRRRVAAALDRRALAANEDDDAPTSSLLPVRDDGPLASTRAASDAPTPVTLRMAVESDCWKCQQFAGLVAAQLRPLLITVRTVAVTSTPAAMRAANQRIDLAALSTELPFPDPASFLTQMLGHDVPRSWLPAASRAAVSRLNRLSGRGRYRAAVKLARRLVRSDVPVASYGAPHIGLLLRPKLGCRHWDAFDFELDLSALCLTAAR